jgi:hypothetical protein
MIILKRNGETTYALESLHFHTTAVVRGEKCPKYVTRIRITMMQFLYPPPIRWMRQQQRGSLWTPKFVRICVVSLHTEHGILRDERHAFPVGFTRLRQTGYSAGLLTSYTDKRIWRNWLFSCNNIHTRLPPRYGRNRQATFIWPTLSHVANKGN